MKIRFIDCLAITLVLMICPVTAAQSDIVRHIDDSSRLPGSMVNITLDIPPSFFGGIIEKLPDGFTFEASSHPRDGIRQNGQTVIFALTGEKTVQYTVRVPASGCGVIRGTWENVGTKTSGEIPATAIAVNGTDPSHCSTAPHTPGFSGMAALAACALIGCVFLWQVRR